MSRLAFDKVGAIYVWVAIIVVFSIWVPDTFPNLTTAKQILNANAITALAALSVTSRWRPGSSTCRSRST